MVKVLLERQRGHFDYFFDSLDVLRAENVLKKMLECRGSIILSGVGKSGLIAKKIAMTLLSTGTRAFYLAPGEALHGDIALVQKNDLVLLFSKSGETAELLQLLPHLKNREAEVIGVVSRVSSRLGNLCDDYIYLPLKAELCPLNMAPMTSAALQLVFGDILSAALMEAKGFSLEEYSQNHPSGNIGLKTSLRVGDLMLIGDLLPLCKKEDVIMEVLPRMSQKQCGCLMAVDENMRLQGVFTDGDLRRAIDKSGALFAQKQIVQVMSVNPKWISRNVLAVSALQMMEENPDRLITVLPVLEDGCVVGLIKLHQLVQAGLRG